MIVDWAPITETEWIPPFGEELERHIQNYKNPYKRRASCSAWATLYKLMTENNLPICDIRFGKNGKPFFAQGHVFFSISHSRGVCAAAVSDRPVGVDVEICREDYKQSMVEKCLTTSEKRLFDGDFTKLWCRKESVAKMTGEGMNGYPNHIETRDSALVFFEKKIEYASERYWLVGVNNRLTDCECCLKE